MEKKVMPQPVHVDADRLAYFTNQLAEINKGIMDCEKKHRPRILKYLLQLKPRVEQTIKDIKEGRQ